jgi:hypothetical protein
LLSAIYETQDEFFKSLFKDYDLGYISAKILSSRYLNRELGITTDKEET